MSTLRWFNMQDVSTSISRNARWSEVGEIEIDLGDIPCWLEFTLPGF